MGIFESESDFNKYKFFYAVAECRSFSKAAELLHISQPAISHAVKELENQLNTKLFPAMKKLNIHKLHTKKLYKNQYI